MERPQVARRSLRFDSDGTLSEGGALVPAGKLPAQARTQDGAPVHEVSIPVSLQGKALEYIEAELARNTRASYKSAIKGFCRWCEGENRTPLPATAGTIVGYVTHLASTGRPWSTINQHLSAIVRLHEGKTCPIPHAEGASCYACGGTGKLLSPRDEAAVRRACKGIRRTHGTAPKHKKRALLRADLERVLAALPEGSLMSVRDRAIVLLAFACALRREEVSELDVPNVSFGPRGMDVFLKSSKTDQEGKGHVMGVPSEAARTIQAVREWLSVLGSTEGPLFRDFSVKKVLLARRLSPQGVGKLVLRALERAGVIARQPRRKPAGQPRRIRSHGAHSLRAGFITQAKLDGKALDEIMSQSRHKSYEVARGYVRHVNVYEVNAARGVAL